MQTQKRTKADQNPRLVVDLDGSLLQGDTLHEGLLECALHKPQALLRALTLLLQGNIAGIKTHIATHVDITKRAIPVNGAVLHHVAEEKKKGGQPILATAAPKKWAAEINKNLGEPFETILATTSTNLRGNTKLEAILQTTNGCPFDYIGNCHQDIPIWKHAREAFCVNPKSQLLQAAKKQGIRLLPMGKPSRKSPLWEALRPHQWLKNLLVFVPVAAAHQYTSLQTILEATGTLTTFCMAASGTYLVNDLWDATHDRKHPKKYQRPVASGTLPIPQAALLAVLLVTGAMGGAALLAQGTATILGAYLAIGWFYSHHGKKQAMLDVCLLAVLYCLRILAGGQATGIPVSHWLLGGALLLFASLGLGKRSAELHARRGDNPIPGRGYQTEDKPTVTALGCACIAGACIMLCLYIQSPEAAKVYPKANLLWGLPLISLFWGGRFWLLAGRGQIQEDPVLFAMEDKTSWLCAASAAILLLSAH
jgi:4-hydroxybenzoate polyprenyltransferase/phosphoserine phosphatase